MGDPVRPVLQQAPLASQKWVNADGTPTPYFHRYTHSFFMRTGGYNDDVWRALGVGVTGLTQINQVNYRVEGVEAALAAVQGAVTGLRGDPRLEVAADALELALAAMVQVQARASGQTDKRLGDIDRLVASLGARTTKAQQAVEFQAAALLDEAVSAKRLQTGFAQRDASNQLDYERRIEEVETQVDALTTTDVAEGSNLYYTSTRADARIAAAVGVSVQAYDADLTAFAGKTAPGGAVVGTTDTQTLTNKTLTAPVLGGTTDLTGGQLKFPATQSASANPNTLDDYEEGTWTPTWNGGTVTLNFANFTKIGDLVFIIADLSLGASASGAESVFSSPFPLATNYGGGSVIYTTYGTPLYVNLSQAVAASTPIGFRAAHNGGGLACSALSGARIIFQATYKAS